MVVRTQESVKDVIRLLYEKNVSGALIADSLEPVDLNATFTTSFSHPYVRFVSFSNMVLWSLEEFKKHQTGTEKDHAKGSKKINPCGFFSLLDKIAVVSEAKIGDLPASFLWNPVFPVKLDQTLFHVLLLLSKHRLSAVPVTEHSTAKVVGYVTEVINSLLLQFLYYFYSLHYLFLNFGQTACRSRGAEGSSDFRYWHEYLLLLLLSVKYQRT